MKKENVLFSCSRFSLNSGEPNISEQAAYSFVPIQNPVTDN